MESEGNGFIVLEDESTSSSPGMAGTGTNIPATNPTKAGAGVIST